MAKDIPNHINNPNNNPDDQQETNNSDENPGRNWDYVQLHASSSQWGDADYPMG
jgi:hypothetical protein